MSLSLSTEVSLVEMLPRDGFQRYGEFVPTDEKVETVDALSTTGVDEIEVTSFAHPDAVPTLRDAEEVAARVRRREDVTYRALVPNDIGMERAIEANVDKVNALVVVSDGYRERNQGMTLPENLEQVRCIVDLAAEADIDVEAGIGTSFFCPYEGWIPESRTLSVVEKVLAAGVDGVTLAATTGMAHPKQVASTFEALAERHPSTPFGFHLHDTNGMGLANTLTAMDCGVDRFDASVCGLGGGTILPGGMTDIGNIPTEDLANMLRGTGVETGIDFERLETVAREVSDRLDLGATSHVLMGGTPEAVLDAGDARG
jgi:hydroxymethylglutaryl-CoA lyase